MTYSPGVQSFLLFMLAVYCTFALVHALLFLFHRQLRENLYYFLFMVTVACYVFAIADGNRYLARVVEVPFVLTLVLFFYSLFCPQRPRRFWALLALGVFVLAMWVRRDDVSRIPEPTDPWNLSFNIFVLTGLFETLRVTFLALRRKDDGAWIIAIGLACLALPLIALTATNLDVLPRPEFLEMGGSRMIFLQSCFFGLLFSMSIYLARNHGRVYRDLEVRLGEVETLSAQALEQERRIRGEEVQRRLFEGEVRAARQMQTELMPTRKPAVAGLDVAGQCRSATEVGGDLFQYFPGTDGISIASADVTGHAMEAAIPVVLFNGMLDAQMDKPGTLPQLFQSLNRSLCRSLGKQKFVCFTMAEIDGTTLHLASCGNPYPLHYHSGDVTELQVDGYPLGVREHSTYDTMERQLSEGDYLVMYSDGIPETVNESGELFGYERTMETVKEACSDGVSAEDLVERLMGAARAFAGGADQEDDMTCVVVRVEA